MKNKRFLKESMMGLACVAIMYLISSPVFGQIVPFSQDISIQYGNLFDTYTLDTSIFASPFLQDYSYGSTMTNPYAAVSNQSSYYGDLFSTASDQSFSYQNIFGSSFSTGTNMYADPFYSTGGGYLNIGTPGTYYGNEYDYTQSITGGSSHFGNTLVLPWTSFSADINTAYGMDAMPFAAGYSASSTAFGMPTIFSGFGREAEGVLNLMAYAPMTAQMDRVLGDQRMYTSDGMAFYGVASYFNPANASNYFFAPGTKISVGGTGYGWGGSASIVTGGGGWGGSGSVVTGGGAAGGGGSPAATGGGLPSGWSPIVYP